MDVYLTVVDELNQRLQVVENDVLQHDHRVFARRTLRNKETNVNHRLLQSRIPRGRFIWARVVCFIDQQ